MVFVVHLISYKCLLIDDYLFDAQHTYFWCIVRNSYDFLCTVKTMSLFRVIYILYISKIVFTCVFIVHIIYLLQFLKHLRNMFFRFLKDFLWKFRNYPSLSFFTRALPHALPDKWWISSDHNTQVSKF